VDADAGGAVGPGAAHGRDPDRGADQPRAPRLTLILAAVLALVVGCTLAFQAYYIWQLHGRVAELQTQTEQLHAQVCNYQAAALAIAAELAARGKEPPLPVPPHPVPCP
jgi:hypothetical protein